MSPRWALFISGRGSTAQAVMDVIDWVNVRVVVSSRANAPGLFKARRAGIPTMILPQDADKQVRWSELHQSLQQRGIERIFLLGFMRIIPESFLKPWSGRIWNVHPSLLPLYPGAKALESALVDNADVGVSIHDVIPEMDAGQIRRQLWVSSAGDYNAIDFSMCEQQLVRDWASRQSFRGFVKEGL